MGDARIHTRTRSERNNDGWGGLTWQPCITHSTHSLASPSSPYTYLSLIRIYYAINLFNHICLIIARTYPDPLPPHLPRRPRILSHMLEHSLLPASSNFHYHTAKNIIIIYPFRYFPLHQSDVCSLSVSHTFNADPLWCGISNMFVRGTPQPANAFYVRMVAVILW